MKIILAIISGISAVFLLVKPGAAASAVRDAVSDCLETIVPSLFAFTVLSCFLQKSGLYRIALKPLAFPLSKLLRMDEELCAVFLLANTGGYPVGAKLLSGLVSDGRISEKDAGRMLCCCMASGPGFMTGIVGMKLFGSASAGLALFGISLAASLVMAAFIRTRGEIKLARAESRYSLTAEAFVSSVTDAARVMFTVCAVIVGFSAVSAMLKETGVTAFVERFAGEGVFAALLEVSRIKEISSEVCGLPLCSALLSFGGVCVLLQIAAVAGNIPLKGLFISRLPAAIICALLSLPFRELFQPVPPENVEALAPGTAVEPFTGNAALSLCVLAMCGILLAGELREKRARGGRASAHLTKIRR